MIPLPVVRLVMQGQITPQEALGSGRSESSKVLTRWVFVFVYWLDLVVVALSSI
jgi:hypothetical protein